MAAVSSRSLVCFSIGVSREEPSLQEKISTAIFRLETLLDRARELRFRFEARDRELWRMIIEMLQKGDNRRARVYAGELTQVRNILKLIKALELMIEMVKERLQTVHDMREFTRILLSFGTAVEELKEEARGLYPGLVYAFDEISRSTRTLLTETSLEGIPDVDPTAVTAEASTILNQALKEAEREVREKFPEAPVEPTLQVVQQTVGWSKPARAREKPRRPGRTAPNAQQARLQQRARRKYSIEELEKLVLDYIQNHGGFLDLADFTKKYGVTREEVFRALKSLAEKGLISLT